MHTPQPSPRGPDKKENPSRPSLAARILGKLPASLSQKVKQAVIAAVLMHHGHPSGADEEVVDNTPLRDEIETMLATMSQSDDIRIVFKDHRSAVYGRDLLVLGKVDPAFGNITMSDVLRTEIVRKHVRASSQNIKVANTGMHTPRTA